MTSVYWAARFIPSGLISVLFGLRPVVAGVMAALWLGERVLTPFPRVGLGSGIAGRSGALDSQAGAPASTTQRAAFRLQ